MKSLLTTYLKPMLDANIDSLVLGCTHYPYLIPLLTKMLPANVQIIDSGEAVARQTKAVLSRNELLNLDSHDPKIVFYSNTSTRVMELLLNNTYPMNYLDF
jgi:glutamate racemase